MLYGLADGKSSLASDASSKQKAKWAVPPLVAPGRAIVSGRRHRKTSRSIAAMVAALG